MTKCKYESQYWLCPNSLPSDLQHGAYLNGHGCKYSKEDYYAGELLCMADECKRTGQALKTDLNTQKTNGEM